MNKKVSLKISKCIASWSGALMFGWWYNDHILNIVFMVLFNMFSTSGHSTGKLSGEQRERLFLDSFVQLFGEEWIGVLIVI